MGVLGDATWALHPAGMVSLPHLCPPAPLVLEGAQGGRAQHPHTEIPMLRKSPLTQGLGHPSLLPQLPAGRTEGGLNDGRAN